MTSETLKKANEISERLENCRENLKDILYTQSENVVIRPSYLRFNGIKNAVTIPHTLFRTIGKLIASEYIAEINKLENELNQL